MVSQMLSQETPFEEIDNRVAPAKKAKMTEPQLPVPEQRAPAQHMRSSSSSSSQYLDMSMWMPQIPPCVRGCVCGNWQCPSLSPEGWPYDPPSPVEYAHPLGGFYPYTYDINENKYALTANSEEVLAKFEQMKAADPDSVSLQYAEMRDQYLCHADIVKSIVYGSA